MKNEQKTNPLVEVPAQMLRDLEWFFKVLREDFAKPETKIALNGILIGHLLALGSLGIQLDAIDKALHEKPFIMQEAIGLGVLALAMIHIIRKGKELKKL